MILTYLIDIDSISYINKYLTNILVGKDIETFLDLDVSVYLEYFEFMIISFLMFTSTDPTNDIINK
jgi:hypothetical protein